MRLIPAKYNSIRCNRVNIRKIRTSQYINGSVVDSATNRNEYWVYFLAEKAAGA